MELYSRDICETYLGMFAGKGKMVEKNFIAMDVNRLNDWYCEGML